ncbi:MAG: hypothetical protein Q8O84_00490 [Nanoarchaeota archaeon]|nr:hypothetical protein [Nanoarchaeota archaeon]
MTEKNQIFSSKMKYDGIFSFSGFYKFCYDYLTEEFGFYVAELKYSEKITGDAKEIKIEWEGEKKITDYFKYVVKVDFNIIGLKNVEVQREGKKIQTNKGLIEISMKGILVSDYEGKYNTSPALRFFRGVYEKWIIPSTIEQIEDKLVSHCDGFLGEAKAYLDLEGKR